MITKEQALEQLIAIEEFAKDLREYLGQQNIPMDKAPAKETKKTEKTKKVEEIPVVDYLDNDEAEVEVALKAEVGSEVDLNEIISEYGLVDWTLQELKEILNSNNIEYNKQAKKKEPLIELVAQGIASGAIPTEEEGEEANPTEEGDELDPAEEEEAPESARNLAEKAVAEDLITQFETKKLKESTIKAYLKAHYNGEPDCKDCREGCTKEEMLKCYVELKQNLVDDEGELHKESDAYYRDGNLYCCGEELKILESGNGYCEVCGEEYILSEDEE